MVLFRVTGGKFGRIFSLGLLLLVTARVSRQQGTRQIFSITPWQWHIKIMILLFPWKAKGTVVLYYHDREND